MNTHKLAAKFMSDKAAQKTKNLVSLSARFSALERKKDLKKRFDSALELELKNGKLIRVDELKVGSFAYTLGNDELPIPLPAGNYQLKDGQTLTIGNGGTIIGIKKS